MRMAVCRMLEMPFYYDTWYTSEKKAPNLDTCVCLCVQMEEMQWQIVSRYMHMRVPRSSC